MSEDERKTAEEDDIEARQVNSIIDDLMDLRKMRATDTMRHRRTILAKKRCIEEESTIEVKKNMWYRIFREYLKENYDEKGNVKDDCLSDKEEKRLEEAHEEKCGQRDCHITYQ